jgi:ABC-type multidrug transport system fused ATPase/permease subunit
MGWERYAKKTKDARIQISSQYIEVLRHLRFYAWQEVWLQKVFEARHHELHVRFVGSCLGLLTYTVTTSAGALFPVAAFIGYTAIAKQELRIDLIFPALQLFTAMQSRLRELPGLITSLLDAYVSLERIDDFEREPEITKVEQFRATSSITTASLTNCSFAWPGKPSSVLCNIDLVLSQGLTLMYGEIGSGKTGTLYNRQEFFSILIYNSLTFGDAQ